MRTTTRTATYKTASGNDVELRITAKRGTRSEDGTTDGVSRYSIERTYAVDSVELIVNGESKLQTEYHVYDITKSPAAAKLRKNGYVAAMFSDGRPVVGFTADQLAKVNASHEAAVADASTDTDYASYRGRMAKAEVANKDYQRQHEAIERVRNQ